MRGRNIQESKLKLITLSFSPIPGKRGKGRSWAIYKRRLRAREKREKTFTKSFVKEKIRPSKNRERKKRGSKLSHVGVGSAVGSSQVGVGSG